MNPFFDTMSQTSTLRGDTNEKLHHTQTVIGGRPRTKSNNQRKEPEREFFEMTVLSFQLSHPMSTTIMTLDRNKLFSDCKTAHASFHLWP